MAERYSIVEDPDGGVSVAVNHEIQVQSSELSNSPQCSVGGDIEMGHSHRAATVLGDSRILIRSRQGRVDIELIHQEEQRRQTYGIGVQMCAFVLLMSSVVNVSVYKRLVDILSVIFSSLTLMAVRYDVGFVSKCQFAIHGSFAMGVIIPLALYHNWGQVLYQLGCMSLCIFCLILKST